MTAPDFYSYRPLPVLVGDTDEERVDESRLILQEMMRALREQGATSVRWTAISPEYPKEPYPHGLYVEGWKVRPDEQPPFSYPLDGGAATERLCQGCGGELGKGYERYCGECYRANERDRARDNGRHAKRQDAEERLGPKDARVVSEGKSP